MYGKIISSEEFDSALSTPSNYRTYAIKWNKKNPTANSCHVTLSRAVKAGKLEKPTQCEEHDETCSERIEACHYDYQLKNALKVRWLCTKHHVAWDKKRKLQPGEEYAF